MKAEQIIEDTKLGLLERLKDVLNEIDKPKEVYFHDLVSEELDLNTPQDRITCLELIDTANEEHFDSGLIDNSSLDRSLVTRAYLSIEQSIFNDDLIQELQSDLNNEEIDKKQAKEILSKIEEFLNSVKKPIFRKSKDNNTQVFIETSFKMEDIKKEDFLEMGLKDKQVMDLSSEGFKILTSNKSINQNAIVLSKYRGNKFRLYLMEKDKDLDIRNLLKLECISEETGFNLSPSAYLEQTTEQYENDKRTGKRQYLYNFKTKELLINQIVRMANKLTEKSIGEIEAKKEALK